jgi:hypothetical protein
LLDWTDNLIKVTDTILALIERLEKTEVNKKDFDIFMQAQNAY